MTQPIDAAILGYAITSRNRGVLALGASLFRLCREASSARRLIILTDHSRAEQVPIRTTDGVELVPSIPCRLSPRSRPQDHLFAILLGSLAYRCIPVQWFRKHIRRTFPWIDAMARSRIVGDIRGGDSFSDIYGMGRFLLGFFRAWTAILVRGKLVQFPQTFGPYKSRLARVLARYLLLRSLAIIARDKESQKVAQDLIGPRKQVLLSPDVAFSLEAIRPTHVQVDPPIETTGGEPIGGGSILGINVNGLMFNGGYTRGNQFDLELDYRTLVPAIIAELANKHEGEIWLIPHTYGPPDSVESDPEACRKVRGALPPDLQRRVRIVTGEYDCHEIKGVIGLCDFFVGSRMHACIAALSQGIPCVGIAYSMKFRGVFESVGMEDWVIDGRSVDNAHTLARVVTMYGQREGVRRPLATASSAARTQLHAVFRSLLGT